MTRDLGPVLVTGGTGMIGANLIRRLVRDGHRVALLHRPTSDFTRLEDIRGGIQSVTADIRDEKEIRDAVSTIRPRTVFHLASTVWAKTPSNRQKAHFQVNVLGTYSLLNAVKDIPDLRFVYSGSSACYADGAGLSEDLLPQPGTLYGASKASAALVLQTFARLHGIHTVELRLFTPYGYWEHPTRLIPHVILCALRGLDLPLTEGLQQRDFVFVDDTVEALLLAAAADLPPGSVFNIGSGTGVAVRDVVQTLLRLMGDPIEPRFGALPSRPDEIRVMSADISRARKQLDWEPKTSLADGLQASVDWYKSHLDLVDKLT